MSQRFPQEEKFKNITLKFEQAPMHSSNIVRTNATNADKKDNYRPSTPLNSSKYIMHEGQNLNIEIITSQVANQRASPNTSSPKARSQIRKRLNYQQDQYEDKNDDNQSLIRQLEQKEQIINQLKNIIKLSHENNSRIKPKSLYQADRSPDRQRTVDEEQKELKELRHNVKVLTIQNNALSGYIDKLKDQMNQRDASQNAYRQGTSQSEIIRELRQENKRLKQEMKQNEYRYQQKIDEYVSTYKSLANQCKRLQNQKQILSVENQRLNSLLRDYQQTHRKVGNREQDKLGKTFEKTSLVKIKEQYAQSVKQIRETINIQVQNLFDNFRVRLNEIDKSVSYMERRIKKIEQQLRSKNIERSKASRQANKKSQIYIEEGSQSFASQNGARKPNNLKSIVVSRLYEQNSKHSHNEEQLVKPLQQEVLRLKEVISDLENQMSERSDYYTFRQRSQTSQAEIQSYRATIKQKQQQLKNKEREMIQEINILKEEIGKLQQVYRQQRKNNQKRIQEEIEYKDDRISALSNQLDDVRAKYAECLDQIKNMIDARRDDELTQEINNLRQQNEQALRKIEQYKKLCNLLQEETQENTVNYQLFDQMKKQIFEIKQRYSYDIVKYNATEKQNKEILVANQQFKQKLESALAVNKKLQQDLEQSKKTSKKISTERQELIERINYNQKVIKILEGEIKAKKDMQISLIEQKNALEKQLINYLSIFNKLTFEEFRYSSRKGAEEELGLQDLLDKLSKIQASYLDQHSSKRQKRQIITKLMNGQIDQDQLSSIKRKGRQ